MSWKRNGKILSCQLNCSYTHWLSHYGRTKTNSEMEIIMHHLKIMKIVVAFSFYSFVVVVFLNTMMRKFRIRCPPSRHISKRNSRAQQRQNIKKFNARANHHLHCHPKNCAATTPHHPPKRKQVKVIKKFLSWSSLIPRKDREKLSLLIFYMLFVIRCCWMDDLIVNEKWMKRTPTWWRVRSWMGKKREITALRVIWNQFQVEGGMTIIN